MTVTAGLGRGYGRRQIIDKCSTILRIIDTLSERSYTYTQLREETKINRNILRTTLDLLVSEKMVARNKYSFQNEGNGRKKGYYTLNLGHTTVAAALNKEELKVNIIEQISNLVLKNKGKFTRGLYGSSTLSVDNKQKSYPYFTKMSLVQPPKDENPNAISKQFEYLIDDIKHFVDKFIKHYYPPEEQRPYYARAVWLLRQLFRQYSDNRHHRDLFDWSEIYLAYRGLHPSGKSAKELSARYGEKIRRYNKYTGEPIYGRKGISRKHIQRKDKDMSEFIQEFYILMPIFMFMHIQFKNKKEKLIVDHTIDGKQSKDIRKR